MRVPFIHGPGDVRLDEIAAPEAGPGDVLVRVASCGVCGSDLGYAAVGGISGPTPRPIPLGHELSGTVATVGGDVRSVRPGDRVIVNPIFNAIGNGGPEGGFAEQLLVRGVAANPAMLIGIPDDMSFDKAALAEPLCVSLHALNRGGAKPGDKVAIFGAGPIGLGAVAALRQRGIEDVVVFDLSAFRRARAIALGAAAAIDPREESPATALARIHGTTRIWDMDAVQTGLFIDMAGAPGIIEDILAIAPLGARIIVTAVYKAPVALDLQLLLAREVSIIASMGYPDEFDEVLGLLAAIDTEPLISHRFAGADFEQAFATAKDADRAAKVLVRYDL